MAAFADTPENRRGRANIRLDGGAFSYFTFTFQYDTDGNPINIVIYDSTGTEITDPSPNLTTKITNVIPPFTPPFGEFLWESDGANALMQISDNDNLFLGSGSPGSSVTTGKYNLIAYNNFSTLTTENYNTIIGRENLDNASGGSVNFIAGFQNAKNATSSTASFLFGDRNNDLGASDIDWSFISGQFNARNATDISYSFFNGYNNGGGATNYNFDFINGLNNNDSGNNLSYCFINGAQNLRTTLNTSFTFANGFNNAPATDIAPNSFFNGRDNLAVATRAQQVFASGYRNLYQSASNIANTIAIGYENGYNAVNQSNSIYLGYRQGYTTGAANILMIGMSQDNPLLSGHFTSDWIRVDGYLEVRDKTGTATTLTGWEGDKLVDTGISVGSISGIDQTLSFSNPDLTISGAGGNTIDISGVNYWSKSGSDISYSAGKVSIGTTNNLYDVEIGDAATTTRILGVVRDGNGNFGVDGYIMTSNNGKLLWESPSSLLTGVATMNFRVAGSTFVYEGLDGASAQVGDPIIFSAGANITLTQVGNGFSIAATGGSSLWTDGGTFLSSNSHDITVEDINFTYRNTNAITLNGRDSTGWLTDVVIGSGLSLSSGTLSATGGSSVWTESGVNVYVTSKEVGINTTNPTESLEVIGDIKGSLDFHIGRDIIDSNGSSGVTGQVLSQDSGGVIWKTGASYVYGFLLRTTASSNQTINTSVSDINFASGSGTGITVSTASDTFTALTTATYRVWGKVDVTSTSGSLTPITLYASVNNSTSTINFMRAVKSLPAAYSESFFYEFRVELTVSDNVRMKIQRSAGGAYLSSAEFNIERII